MGPPGGKLQGPDRPDQESGSGEAAIVQVSGLIDEHFAGFGDPGTVKALILDVSGMTRMTSFGVRQWLRAVGALPKTVTDLYLLGCPTFFVDQLNMVLNFGGAARVLTVTAPFVCTACGTETGAIVDVLDKRASLAKGIVPDTPCPKCNGAMQLDETPESYFAFVSKYGATNLVPSAARLLGSGQLYAVQDTGGEKPPKIIKLVRGSVTYFRIAGTMAANFRARPLLVGSEGEVVIDLADVPRFDVGVKGEWRRLIRSLAPQVPAITLVDLDESFFTVAADTLRIARNIAVQSVRVPYMCMECSKRSSESVPATWPLALGARVCATCGGSTQHQTDPQAFSALQHVSAQAPNASAKLIEQREEILSRAMTDARVAEAGDRATATITSDDTILGKYKIVRPLSEGGMAEVFLAQQVGLEKPVALKRIQRKLLDQRHLAIDMFLNEAKIAGRLTHPNIVQVLDVGEVGGALYLAMEYIHGRELREVLTRHQKTQQPISLAEVCHICREVALALHHAYFSTDIDGTQLSVVHRDVSPQNILLGYDGAVKLLDFGVAMSSVTEHDAGMIVGKWRYIAPEATTKGPIDHRSDLFSLGVILYMLCTNSAPFSGRDPREIVKKIRSGQYRPVQEAAPHVPPKLARLLESLLKASPEARPASGADVAAQLAEIASEEGYQMGSRGVAGMLERLFGSDTSDSLRLEVLSASDRSLTRGSASMSMSISPSPSPRSRISAEIVSQAGQPGQAPQVPQVPQVPQATQRPPVAQVVTSSPQHVPPRPNGSQDLSKRTKIAIAIVLVVLTVALYFVVRPT